MIVLSAKTKISDLLKTYPFLEDFLVSYDAKFEMLKNRMARATIGRLATLRTAAGIANLDLDSFVKKIAFEIEDQTGKRPNVELSEQDSALTREQRLDVLKEIIRDLHDGGDLDKARQRFTSAVEDVEASEIAAMEEDLIKGGLPVSEVQRLCDVHVSAFKPVLDEHAQVQAPPGHPVHTYLAANKKIIELADKLGELAGSFDPEDESGTEKAISKAKEILAELSGLDNHYQRKENQLFAVLERHGVTGPSKVMWGVHDQIRQELKDAQRAVEINDMEGFSSTITSIARDVVEMVYKEEKILFPLALQTLSDGEWIEVRQGEDELGYAFAEPASPWPKQGQGGQKKTTPDAGFVSLMTGELSFEQLNLIFKHLPVDLSFVDENDEVRFYSEGPDRIFPRSPAVIGRKVQNCHPPKSLQTVQKILDSFRSGNRNEAEFWIQIQGRFIHIRYFAVRNEAGEYRGCLEMTQDVTRIQKLEGNKRLLDWDSNGF